MVILPETNSFLLARVASLRAAQLMRGCTPLVAHSAKATVTALREVAAGLVERLPPVPKAKR